jgi:methionyl-tRNA formyltransferase
VLDGHLAIACGTDALRPLRLQRPGRGAQGTDAFLRGFAVPPGTILACPATS